METVEITKDRTCGGQPGSIETFTRVANQACSGMWAEPCPSCFDSQLLYPTKRQDPAGYSAVKQVSV